MRGWSSGDASGVFHVERPGLERMDSGVSCSRRWNLRSGARDTSCPVLSWGHPSTLRGAGLGCRVSPFRVPCAGSQPGAVGWWPLRPAVPRAAISRLTPG